MTTTTTTTPKISEVQRELAKFLEDFEAVKYLVEDDPVPSSSAPSTSSHRESIYDNVPFLVDDDDGGTARRQKPAPQIRPVAVIPAVPEIHITNPTLDRKDPHQQHRPFSRQPSYYPGTSSQPPSSTSSSAAPYSTTFPRARSPHLQQQQQIDPKLKTFEPHHRLQSSPEPDDDNHQHTQQSPPQPCPRHGVYVPRGTDVGIASRPDSRSSSRGDGGDDGDSNVYHQLQQQDQQQQHVRCHKCGEFLCSGQEYYPASAAQQQQTPHPVDYVRCAKCNRLVLEAARRRGAATGDERDVVGVGAAAGDGGGGAGDDSSWRSSGQHHQHPGGSGRVRFILDDYNNGNGDKVVSGSAVRWGGSARVVPMKNHNHHHSLRHPRRSRSRVRVFLVTLAVVIVILSLLGIVVAVTCASILSALQEDVNKAAMAGCSTGLRAYQAHLVVTWLYNSSCDAQRNDTLADPSHVAFIRASKVYEALLDSILRNTRSRDIFDFTKVQRIMCTMDETDVWVNYKIFWKVGEAAQQQQQPPQPEQVLHEFLGSLRNINDDTYRVSSLSVEGYIPNATET